MSKMGTYCKAYPIDRFRQFPGWSEDSQNLRKQEVDGKPGDTPRELTEQDHFFLQEDFTVTDGIFIDENIIFGQEKVSPEWKEYCEQTLQFAVPVYEPIIPATEPIPAEAAASDDAVAETITTSDAGNAEVAQAVAE